MTPDRPKHEAPPADLDEALARARRHGRRAAAEAAAALRALLDAASLGASGAPSAAHGIPHLLEQALIDLESFLSSDSRPDGARVLDSVLGALDGEIARWEERSREDPDARAVLRAFLGLREILWEFGVRAPDTSTPGRSSPEPHEEGPENTAGRRPPPAPSPAPGRMPRKAGARRPRVQRVPIEG